MAWSPDGRFLATGAQPVSGESTARLALWNAKTGERVWEYESASSRVNPLRFSDDGKRLLESVELGALALDVATGKKLDHISQGQTSTDGSVIVFRGNGDRTLVVERKGKQNQRLTIAMEGDKSITGFRISPDGRWIVTENSGKEWDLWDARNGERIRECQIPRTASTTVDFTPDGKKLIAGNSFGIFVFHTETRQRGRDVGMLRGPFLMAVGSKGKRIATAQKFGGTVHIWNLETGQPEQEIRGAMVDVRSMAFSPDGSQIALAGQAKPQSGRLGVWDIASGKERLDVIGHDSPAKKLTFSLDGRLLATASLDGSICIWEVKTRRLLHKLQNQFAAASGDLRFSPDGWLLGVSGQLGDYRIWEVSTGDLLVENGRIQNLSTASESRFSPELDRLAVGSHEGQVHIVETSTGKQLSVRKVFGLYETGAMAFSGDGRFLAVGAYRSRTRGAPRGTVVLWDLENDKEFRDLKSPEPANGRSSEMVEALEFSPDGGTLAARHSALGLEIWHPFEGMRIERVPNQAGRPMAFSQTGQVLVLLTAPGLSTQQSLYPQLDLMEPATGCVFQSWNMPKESLAFALSPDARLLALSLMNSRQILLYDLAPPSSQRAVAEDDLQKAVGQLNKHDAVEGRDAMAVLISAGERSVPVLARQLKPTGQPVRRNKEIERLIRELDHDDFFRREQASKNLADLGPVAVPALKKALENKPSLEAANRIRAILKYASTAGKISGESLQSLRAIEILERIGTAEARELLHSLAEGPETSHEARLARWTLKRIRPSAAGR